MISQFSLLGRLLIFLGLKRRTVHTGSKAKLYIGGKLVGEVKNVTYSVDHGPIDVLGRLEVEEMGPIKMEATVVRECSGPEWDEFMKVDKDLTLKEYKESE